MSKAEKLVVGVLVSFAIGILLRVAGALSPIHEIGHILCAWLQGSGGRISGWNTSSIEHVTNEVLIAGHYFELFVYFALLMIFRVKKTNLSAFFLGCLMANISKGAKSVDIRVDLLRRTDATYVSNVLVLWALINLAFLTWAVIALTIEIIRRAELLNASERSNKREVDVNTPSEETFFAIRREVDLMAHRRQGKKGA